MHRKVECINDGEDRQEAVDMEDDFSSAWDVPRPAVRLWLSLALGLLGAFLLPAQDFAPHTFDNFLRVALIAWIVAAFVSVLLLHRVEKAKVPMGICAIMGLALLAALKKYDFIETVIFGVGSGLGFTLAIVLMAGIREQLDLSDVPAPLKGAGIALVVAGIMALAFQGFIGMIE